MLVIVSNGADVLADEGMPSGRQQRGIRQITGVVQVHGETQATQSTAQPVQAANPDLTVDICTAEPVQHLQPQNVASSAVSDGSCSCRFHLVLGGQVHGLAD